MTEDRLVKWTDLGDGIFVSTIACDGHFRTGRLVGVYETQGRFFDTEELALKAHKEQVDNYWWEKRGRHGPCPMMTCWPTRSL
jgi:hypothetical protein